MQCACLDEPNTLHLHRSKNITSTGIMQVVLKPLSLYTERCIGHTQKGLYLQQQQLIETYTTSNISGDPAIISRQFPKELIQ